MNYLIDPKKLYSTLADMESDERGKYLLIACMDMMSDRASKHDWIVSETEPKKKRASKRVTYEGCKGGYSQEFESFWNLYPRRIGKGAAYLAWKRVGTNQHELLMLCQLALAWQTISEQWTKEKGGLLGSASRAVAKVPFLPEIAGAVTAPTGYGPYVYATLKGLQGGATGRDPLKVGLQAGATILAADLASGLLKGTPAGAEGGFPADYNVEPYGPGGITPDTVLPPLPPVTPPTVPSAFDTAIDTAISGRVGEGAFGQVGTGGFGTAIPSAESVATNLRNAGFSAGTADALAGVNLAGVGAATTAGLPISLSDAVRGLRTASGVKDLLNPPSAGEGDVDQGGAQPTMTGVDYSGLYNLLAQRASGGGLLGTQYQPQPLNLASLLG